MAEPGNETVSYEPAPPSVFGESARQLLDSVRPLSIDSMINAAKAYALLDLADAIRNS
jgi:hypothetical protein